MNILHISCTYMMCLIKASVNMCIIYFNMCINYLNAHEFMIKKRKSKKKSKGIY